MDAQEEQAAALGEEDLAQQGEGQDEGEQQQEAMPAGEDEQDDSMMRSIDREEGGGAEAASNTVATDEAPDVISSYTDGGGQTAVGEEQEEQGEAVEEAGPLPEQQPADDIPTASQEEAEAEAAEAAAGAETAAGDAGDGEEAGADADEGEPADEQEEEEARQGAPSASDMTALEGDFDAQDAAPEEAAASTSEGQGEAGPAQTSAAGSRSRTPEQASQQDLDPEAMAQRGSSGAGASAAAIPAYETSSALSQATSSQQPFAPVPGQHKAIDVEVEQGPGLPYKMVQVALDYSEFQPKPYLGGYKNKKSGAVYHHAWTQTPKAPKYQGVERKLERQTQTVKVVQRTIQTVREAATQMERPGIIIDTSEDRLRTPGPYQTSEERLEIVTRATCTIQRFFRGYLGRKRATYLRQKKEEREAFLREQEIKAKQEAEEHRRREIERRMHPKTASDFEILYNELEAWRLQETRKIKQAGLAPEKEQEVLQQLLHKETKLLQTIDRLKINANHENKELRIQHTLTAMGKPKTFDLKNGNTVEVHTPFTTRAMELMQLYNGLNLPMLTIDERLDVLLHVKWTVKEFDCNLTREIVELIDREADLLNRGRNPRVLEGLRKRISSLFLTFIETPEFNPESARFQIVPMEFEAYLFEKLGKAYARAEDVGTGTAGKWGI